MFKKIFAVTLLVVSLVGPVVANGFAKASAFDKLPKQQPAAGGRVYVMADPGDVWDLMWLFFSEDPITSVPLIR